MQLKHRPTVIARSAALVVAASMLIGACQDPRFRTSADAVIQEFGATHPSAWGGTWFTDNGLRVVAFTTTPRRYGDQLRSRLRSSYAMSVVKVRYTLRDLKTIDGRIINDEATLRAQGIELTGWAVQESENREVIELTRLEPTWMAVLTQRYGAVLEFKQEGFGSF